MKLIKKYLLIVFFFMFSCCQTQQEQIDADNFEYFPLYTTKDITIDKNEKYNTGCAVAVIDTLIQLPKGLSIYDKLNIIAKNVSTRYFRSREIKILKIDSLAFPKTLHLELYDGFDFENPNIPEMDKYNGWYSCFQGSSGGGFTEITLKENFLQKTYKGDWIDALVFYWQGEEMVAWDHINLAGSIKRYNSRICQ